MMPGKKPASAMPSMKRRMKNTQSGAMPVAAEIGRMKANRPEMRPQLSMMRAIQSRAPKRASARLDGTSSRK